MFWLREIQPQAAARAGESLCLAGISSGFVVPRACRGQAGPWVLSVLGDRHCHPPASGQTEGQRGEVLSAVPNKSFVALGVS